MAPPSALPAGNVAPPAPRTRLVLRSPRTRSGGGSGAALFWVAIAAAALGACLSEAAWVSGRVDTPEDFAFVAKFCFAENRDDTKVAGRVSYKLSSERPGTTLQSFRGENWATAYDAETDCGTKLSLAGLSGIDVSTTTEGVGEFIIGVQNHPAFWYFAGVNCLDQVNIRYELRMVNEGPWLDREFSVDEQGFPLMYLVFFIVYSIMASCQTVSSLTLSRLNSFHMIVKLVSAAVFMQWFSVVVCLIHYWVYAANGYGVPFFKFSGLVWDILFQISFMLTLILIAKGWTISTSTVNGKAAVGVVMGMYLFTYFALALWSRYGSDPATTLYLYASWPGWMVVSLRVATTVWFARVIYDTYTHEMHPGKRAFFKRGAVLFGVWFMSLPALVVIAHLVEPWQRAKVVRGIELSFNFCSLAVLQFLLWPTRASEYFKLTPPVMDDKEMELNTGSEAGTPRRSRTLTDEEPRRSSAAVAVHGTGVLPEAHPGEVGSYVNMEADDDVI